MKISAFPTSLEARREARHEMRGAPHTAGVPSLPAQIKNETPKKVRGDRRQEWCLHCRIPHTETSSSAKPRGTPRFLSDLHMGFEPLHLEIRSAELHLASTGCRRRSGAREVCKKCGSIRDSQIRVLVPGLRVGANTDSNMQRFKPTRLAGRPQPGTAPSTACLQNRRSGR